MNPSTPPRRQYPKDFKQGAVHLALEGKQSIAAVARDLGIQPKLLYRWVSEHRQQAAAAFPGAGHLGNPDAEQTRALHRELAQVRVERDILKKALAIFSQRPQ